MYTSNMPGGAVTRPSLQAHVRLNSPGVRMCSRPGCPNLAGESSWEGYCSNECLATQCR